MFELKEKEEVKAVGIGSKDWHIIKELYEYPSFDWGNTKETLRFHRERISTTIIFDTD